MIVSPLTRAAAVGSLPNPHAVISSSPPANPASAVAPSETVAVPSVFHVTKSFE